jgi:ectoine hydroxylase-related dioxygenase (phytanoyl-CoA dioxygenase family)
MKNYCLEFSNSRFFFKEFQKLYFNNGFVVVKNLLNYGDLVEKSQFFLSILHFYKNVSNKLSINTKHIKSLKELDFYVKKLEKKDRDASLEVQKIISQSQSLLNISNNNRVLSIVSSCLNINVNNILFEGFGTLVPNIPNNSTRLYTYHSEAHWLPFRRNFVNCWIPIFRKKKKNSGTMIVVPFSHKKEHTFFEYRGFEKLHKNSYLQYETSIPKNSAEVAIEAKVGDAVFFHRNLLHKSELNKSNDVGYLFVNRYFDITSDLTISSNLNIRPYSQESERIGRKLVLPIEPS